MTIRIAERVEHHDAVCHGRENRPQAMLAIEPLGDPGHRALHRALAQSFREPRRGKTQYGIDGAEKPKPRRLLLRRLRRQPDRLRRLEKQLIDRNTPGVARPRLKRHQYQERHDDRAAPIRDLFEMEGEPLRQQHDLDRHHRNGAPTDETEQRQHHPCKHVRARCAASGADRRPRARHVRGVDGVPDHLERKIGFYARAHVEGALVE